MHAVFRRTTVRRATASRTLPTTLAVCWGLKVLKQQNSPSTPLTLATPLSTSLSNMPSRSRSQDPAGALHSVCSKPTSYSLLSALSPIRPDAIPPPLRAPQRGNTRTTLEILLARLPARLSSPSVSRKPPCLLICTRCRYRPAAFSWVDSRMLLV
jgi:hypothetical protein